MSRKTQREKDQAEKKLNRAIDAMIDLQDLGFGNSQLQRILDALNSLRQHIQRQ
jgi:hypothetical protein